MINNYHFEKFDSENPFVLKLTGEELEAILTLFDKQHSDGALPEPIESVRTDMHTHLILFYEKRSL
jgi:hypothetical protein